MLEAKQSVSLSSGLSGVEIMSMEIGRRLRIILDHLHGPKPEKDKTMDKPMAGVMSSLQRSLNDLQDIERSVTLLESTLGVHGGCGEIGEQSGHLIGIAKSDRIR